MNSYLKNVIRIFFFILPVIIIFLQILKKDHHFTYTLDDPYIHIELAKNIYYGTYGINLSEMSAPSSSILWPFLLVPFGGTDFIQYIPLILNSIFLIISGFLLLKIFKFNNLAKDLFFSMLFLYAFNIYGLVFNGLEHSLQILLVILICYYLLNIQLITAYKKSLIIFFTALVLLPLVRYEGLAISIPVLVYLYFNHFKKPALISVTFLFLIIFIFSLFLYLNNLGYLPSSIIAKTINTNESIIDNFKNNMKVYGWFFSLVFIVAMATWKNNKAIVLVLISTTLLHFLLGKYGWFSRYEIYYLVFASILMIYQLYQRCPNIWYLPIFLITAFPSLSSSTNQTAKASSNIYNQQFRMSEITKTLNAPIAVNDLGLVALRSDQYILDLWGLGSIEALHYRKNPNDVTWIKKLMQKNNVHYVAVYDDWFPTRPDNWLKAGELKLKQRKITPAYDTVTFYATDKAHLSKLKQTLQLYQAQNPSNNYEIIMK